MRTGIRTSCEGGASRARREEKRGRGLRRGRATGRHRAGKQPLPRLLVLFLLAAVAGCGGSGGGGGADFAGSGGSLKLSLAWDPVQLNEDGTRVVDLAGYRVYDGQRTGVYESVTDVGTLTEATFQVAPGTVYFFSVTAYDYSGNESGFSDEIMVDVR